jgi:RNA polymerase sigma-70 factor (ECF subfamily)
VFAPENVERVIRHLLRFGAVRAEAEDLAQEALLIAWRKKDELDRTRSLDGWLFGIARNVYRNHARSARRSPVSDIEVPPDSAKPAPALADVLSLREALRVLPEDQQDIVILHELEEYTLKETAELLAIPFDTAKDRLRRARETLRGSMADEVTVAERRDARQVSGAAVATVLAGLVGAMATAGTAAAATGGAATAAGDAMTTAAKTAWIGKIAIATALVTGGVVVGVVGDRVLSSRGAVVIRDAAIVAEVPADAAVAVPDAAIAIVTIDAAPAPAVDPLPTGPGTDPEAQLIERARTALGRGRADDAIKTLMSHERRFPGGQLAEQRDVLLIDAYVAAGNVALARERVTHYETTYPSGIHRDRVREIARDLERRP